MRPLVCLWMICGITTLAQFTLLSSQAAEPDGADAVARRVLDAAQNRGGLVVHLGCGDGSLTAALGATQGCLVHGLDTDPQRIRQARDTITARGLYGKAAVKVYDGRWLPYTDNLVNLLVISDPASVPREEMLRVLSPNGLAVRVSAAAAGDAAVEVELQKPRPDEIDEWTHDLHDASGNPVGKDQVAGPPKHLQWTAGPLWARSHGWTPSVTAMVSSNGRIFYINDETLAGMNEAVPSRWFLVARDAFSGVLLWKRPMNSWGSQATSGLPDSGGGISVGRFTMPTHAGKRLVAVGDTVYVTLGALDPVSAVDANTGKVIRQYAGTENADEILFSDGRLIVSINPPKHRRPAVVDPSTWPRPAPGKHVCGIDAASGEMLWKAGPFSGNRAGRAQDPFGRLELAAADGSVFLLSGSKIHCLDARSGRPRWEIDRPALPENAVRKLGYSGMYEFQLMVLVYHSGVVLLAQPEPNTHHTYHTMPGTLYAFDAKDGRLMWSHGYGGWGHQTPPDVFAIGDVVWTHVNAKTEFGSVWGGGYRALDPSIVDYRIQALDLATGKTLRELPARDIFNVGHHHRCYRNRSTERYLGCSRRGVEFIDLATGENYQNHWVRSGCLMGSLPCNGMVYVTPHPCGCYIEAKLTGFNALTPERENELPEIAPADRLQQGIAFGRVDTLQSPSPVTDWPTYRHDAQRSGATEMSLSPDLKIAWQAKVGQNISSPVVAGGMLLLADIDAHTIHALNAEDGKPIWSYTADARVYSPPTVSQGRAVFGAADGCVYCLRAADGELVWKFYAAPQQRLVSAFGQLESAWPVPGVLVQDGKCWLAAGRSSYLDGGIRCFSLELSTGKVLHEQTIYSFDPKTGKMPPVPDPHKVAGVLNDIPNSDGRNVFLRQMNISSPGEPGKNHLFTTAGYLDSSWFNRTFWKMGRAQTTGPMVTGQDVAYGVEPFTGRSRDILFQPGKTGYSLRCLPIRSQLTSPDVRRGKKTGDVRTLWSKRLPIRITSLIRAGDLLFAAGSPDIVDPADPHGAWEGRKGGKLAVVSCDDGNQLAEISLPAPPAWDAAAAAGGKLFLSAMDGNVVCLRQP